MFSGNFLFILTVSTITLCYFETLLSIYFKNVWKQLKTLSVETTKTPLMRISLNNNINNTINIIFIIFILTLKTSKILILLPVIIVLTLIKSLLKFNKNHSLVMFSIVVFTTIISYVSNFIMLFMFLEFYAIIFYFYLLEYNKNESTNLIKYKNSLLLYLFNNFVISAFFIFATAHILYSYGTVHFVELSMFSISDSIFSISMLLSILLKLSLPGFHFLKIEMYKYLSLDNVIIFSVITLFVNFILINYLMHVNLISYIFNIYKILNVVIIISVFTIIQKLKTATFQEFVAYSGFATNNLVLLNFLV